MTDRLPELPRETAEVVRFEEHLAVGVERVPVERVRFGKRIVSEERTVTVTVRREELYVERVASTGTAATAPFSPAAVDLVLSEEEVQVVTRVVPRERVRVRVVAESAVVQVSDEVAREVVEVDGVPETRL